MQLTTGTILRRITHTALSCAAHKLATLILDGIAWKDGYNGLPHGTAAFTLSDLAERMEISRQHLHSLLTELATSELRLLRQRGKGRLGRVDKKDSAGPRSVIQAHLYVGDDLGSQPYIRR